MLAATDVGDERRLWDDSLAVGRDIEEGDAGEEGEGGFERSEKIGYEKSD